jgi:hypothetical protein
MFFELTKDVLPHQHDQLTHYFLRTHLKGDWLTSYNVHHVTIIILKANFKLKGRFQKGKEICM